ncbi:MAG: DUF2130 domain-containing protein [Limisphaerales bacterium]
MNPTIVCPACGAEIPLSEAVSHRLREELTRDFEQKQRVRDAAMVDREEKLRTQLEALEKQRVTLDEELRKRLEAERRKLTAEARQQAQDQMGVEMKDLTARLAEQRAQLEAARTAELDFRKRQRELEEQKASMQLEVQRRLDSERAKMAEELRAQAADAERLHLAEKEKVITDLQQQIGLLKQRAEQGSMQLQGEVLELDLEERLRTAFPLDAIESVATGQRGGDVRHRVRTNLGQECGVILWEAKRTRHWGREWPAKLKQDQRSEKADLAVIVSQALPAEIRGFGLLDGVWVCDYACAPPLAAALRHALVQAAMARQSEVGRHGKMEELYTYLTSLEFRQRIEGVVDAFKSLREDLEAEKRALQKHWARREKQLDQAITHTAMLYGGVQGIVGQTALPDIQPLQLPDPDAA